MAEILSDLRFSQSQDSLRGSETILVVDDERNLRGLCAKILARSGYNVLSAGDGLQALQMARAQQGPIHLALLDVQMPKMSGPELLVELLDCRVPRSLDIRFMFMSGYAGPNVLDHLDGAQKRCSFLPKPFTPLVLLQAVRRELDRAQCPAHAI
jgi:two-component system cell cycle sensor histidine kinase/response regulator CckA